MRPAQRQRLRPPESIAELRTGLRAAGLSRLWMHSAWRPVPSVRLIPAARASARVPTGASKFGGDPDLPSGRAWPLGRMRRPLSFLAQIRLADAARVAQAGVLPASGWLWFFADTASTRTEIDCAVLFDEGADQALRSVPAPADSRTGIPAVDVFVERRMQLRTMIGVPEVPPPGLSQDEREAYWSLINPEGIIHKLGGEPNRVQQPVVHTTGNRARGAMLLQLDSDRRLDMQWGDNGRLFFVLPEASLRKASFHRCRAVLQSY